MIKRIIAALCLWCAVATTVGCTRTTSDSAPGDFAAGPLVDAAEIRNTTILPYSDGPIEPGKNYVYCGTFSLAWDELCGVFGEPIVLQGAEDWSRRLNDDPFDKTQLSRDSYLARAGKADDKFIADLQREMAERFPRATLSPPDESLPNAVMVYAYLAKNLPFHQAFDRLQEPLKFASDDAETPVAAFGIEREGDDWERQREMREQIHVLDYVSDDDFILALQTKSATDTMILAKIPPAATLRETIEAVRKREHQLAAWQKSTSYEESVAIPVVVLHVERQFDELINKHFANAALEKTFIAQARQTIRFRLDERGAELESAADVAAATEEAMPAKPRQFIFDKPFLLLLRQKTSTEPYFAMWVANTEFLQPE